jgi:hypothetical protein
LNWFFEPKLSEPDINHNIMVNSRSSSKPLRALRYNVQLHSNQSHEYHLRTIDALRWRSSHALERRMILSEKMWSLNLRVLISIFRTFKSSFVSISLVIVFRKVNSNK